MQIKILVVDDERDVIELIGFNLRAAGYKVDTAEICERFFFHFSEHMGSSRAIDFQTQCQMLSIRN